MGDGRCRPETGGPDIGARGAHRGGSTIHPRVREGSRGVRQSLAAFLIGRVAPEASVWPEAVRSAHWAPAQTRRMNSPGRTGASVGPQPGGLPNKSGPAAQRAAELERQGRRDAARPYGAL